MKIQLKSKSGYGFRFKSAFESATEEDTHEANQSIQIYDEDPSSDTWKQAFIEQSFKKGKKGMYICTPFMYKKSTQAELCSIC